MLVEINNETEVSADSLGNLLGISPRRVQQLAKEKFEARTSKGCYNLFRFVQDYLEYSKDNVREKAPDDKEKCYELELLKWRSANEKLKYMRDTHELIPVNSAVGLFQNIANHTKTQLLTIPDQCKNLDPHFTESQLELLDDLIRKILTELADGEKRATANIESFEAEGEQYILATEEDELE